MKLNFWQWLGLALLVIGLALYALKHSRPATDTPPQNPTPATTPH